MSNSFHYVQIPNVAKTPSARVGSERNQRGIQSVEVGGQLLLALAHHGRPMALKDLARESDMAPAKAHPYLVSFGKLGLIEQDAVSGRYGLGPLALQLGLISLQQFDPVRLATPRIVELAAQIGHTVALAVWGNRGPTIVRIEEAPSAVHVNMRHGTVVSLRGTASGRLFAAYMPRDQVLAALATERRLEQRSTARPTPGALIDRTFKEELDAARECGLSCAIDSPVPGVSAMAAPVFAESGAIVMSLTAIGPTAIFDTRVDGEIASVLRRAASELSRQLGARA
jgi:DNA-binding IclR family transcriptional regulator